VITALSNDIADGCYINTAGIGVIDHPGVLGVATVQPGDVVLVSGPIGDHGVTVMLARGELDIEADLESDTAPVHGLVAELLASCTGVRAMRDATRGGVATILNEVAKAADVAVVVEEDAVPVRAEVRGASNCSASTRCMSRARAGSWWSWRAIRPTRHWPRCGGTRQDGRPR
jgi:hydrogenase expression/formation protein HypE